MKDEELRGFGFKATGPRLKILHILELAGPSHMSAEAIYQELSHNGDDVALATVYRVLAQLEQVGLVLSHQFAKDHCVYELNDGEHHDHMVCSECNHVIEFVSEPIETLQLEIAKEHDFQLTDHSLVMYGVCGNCKKSQEVT